MLPCVYLYGGKNGMGWVVQLRDGTTVGDGETRRRVSASAAVQSAFRAAELAYPVLVHAPGGVASAIIRDAASPIEWRLPTQDGHGPGPLSPPWLHGIRGAIRKCATRLRVSIRYPSRLETVYALLDPDGSVRYVGRTLHAKRIEWHMQGSTQPKVRAWVESLEKSGQSPSARVLAVCPESSARATEQRFLNIFRRRFSLLNTVYQVV